MHAIAVIDVTQTCLVAHQRLPDPKITGSRSSPLLVDNEQIRVGLLLEGIAAVARVEGSQR